MNKFAGNKTETALPEQRELIKVTVPLSVLEKIEYLCRLIYDVEWSGILLYSVKGTIRNPSEMEICLRDIIPMNKGTQSYTEYKFNEPKRNNQGADDKMIDYFEAVPEALDDNWKIGLIHSHNRMSVFFSGTDNDELKENSAAHDFYLSFIVNNAMDMIAKVAFKAKMKKTGKEDFFANDEFGNPYRIFEKNLIFTSEELIVHDCKIELPEKVTPNLDKRFLDSVEDIMKKPSHSYSNNNSYSYSPPSSNSHWLRRHDGDEWDSSINLEKQMEQLERESKRPSPTLFDEEPAPMKHDGITLSKEMVNYLFDKAGKDYEKYLVLYKEEVEKIKKKETKTNKTGNDGESMAIEDFLVDLLQDQESFGKHLSLKSLLKRIEQNYKNSPNLFENRLNIRITEDIFEKFFEEHFSKKEITKNGFPATDYEKKNMVLKACAKMLRRDQKSYSLPYKIAKKLESLRFFESTVKTISELSDETERYFRSMTEDFMYDLFKDDHMTNANNIYQVFRFLQSDGFGIIDDDVKVLMERIKKNFDKEFRFHFEDSGVEDIIELNLKEVRNLAIDMCIDILGDVEENEYPFKEEMTEEFNSLKI